ncbi:MAG: Gfo/Idh/MocA family oxidoreductase [Planctomycetota bacterium]
MIRVGVIGCGYWGPQLVRVFHDCEGSRVAGVCDVVPSKMEAIARRYPTVSCYARAAELIAARDIDLVVVATPLDSHYALARAAIEHGKHVLVEKPLTPTEAQAEELIEFARQKGVLLAVDHTFLFTPAVEKMRELIVAGRLGRINYLDSVRINLGLIQSETNVVWDLAPHDLSIADYLLGRLPHRVVVTGACHTPGGQVDVAYIHLDYGNGLISNVHVSWLSPVKLRRMIIGGDQRMILFDDLSANEKVRVYDSTATYVDAGPSHNGAPQRRVDYRIGDIWTPHLPPREALVVEARHLVAAIEHKEPLRVDGFAGLRVVRILEACDKSLREDGSRVILDGVAREVASASVAMDFLSPSVRRPTPTIAESSGLLDRTEKSTLPTDAVAV